MALGDEVEAKKDALPSQYSKLIPFLDYLMNVLDLRKGGEGPVGLKPLAVGITSGEPTWTDNGGGNVTIGEGTARLFSTSNHQGLLSTHTITSSSFDIPSGVTSYIVVNYNAGEPEYQNITDVGLINESSVIPVFTVVNFSGDLHYFGWDSLADGLANKIHTRLVKTQRFARESGLLLSESAGNVVHIDAGRIWAGANGYDLDAVDSSADTWFLFKHVAGVWTPDLTTTTYSNTHYDDGTDLVAAVANKYLVNWIYRDLDKAGHGGYVLGNAQYNTLAAAQAAPVPSSLPDFIASHGIRIGRIIVKTNGATAEEITSEFSTIYTPSGVVEHNDTGSIQGGTASEYYHLTQTDYTEWAARELKGVSLPSEAEGTTGATLVLDYNDGNTHTATLSTTDCVITITNPPTSGIEGKLKLILTTGGTLPSSITWPAGVTAPTLVVSKRHHLIFTTVDGGANWDCFHAKQEGFA